MQITANMGKILKNVQGDLNFISKIDRKRHWNSNHCYREKNNGTKFDNKS